MYGILKKSLPLIVLAIAVYLGISLYMTASQKQFIYFPDNQNFEDCPGFADSEKVKVDGTRMYFGNLSDTLVVFYHGNAGSACNRAFLKDRIKNLGLSYLFIEYAGYSGDSRKPGRDLILQDAEHAQQFIENKDFDEVVIFGRSLGSAVGAYHTTLSNKASKAVLVSGFNKLSSLAKEHYPYLPSGLLLQEEYEADKWVKDFEGKLLVVHGNRDNIVPIKYGRKLFEAAKKADKEFIEVEGAGHNDILSFDSASETIKNFIQ